MLFATLLITFSVMSVGFVAYRSNPEKHYSIYFLLVSCALAFWVLSNFLVEYDLDNSYLWTLQTFYWVIWAAAFFIGFIANYPRSKYNRVLPFFFGFAFVETLLLISGLLVDGVEIIDQKSNVIVGSLYVTFVVYLGVSAIYLVYSIIKNYITANEDEKPQHSSLLVASGLLVLIGSITNLILPLVQGNNDYANYGTYSTLIFVVIIAHSIWKRGLFDVRSTIARATGYVLALSALWVSYFFVLSFLFNRYSDRVSDSFLTFVIATFTLATGLAVPIVKRFFDKITNRIFFRDSYEPQELIDQLNNALVSTSDVVTLLNKTANIIKNQVKVETVLFYVRETSYFPSRIIGDEDGSTKFSEKEMEVLLNLVPTLTSKIHVRGLNSSSTKEIAIDEILQQNNVQILGRLVSTLEFQVKGIGMFFIGPKRSGGAYTRQDIKLLEIIVNELVIAIENVLRTEEIEQFNVTLQKKIDSATKELKETNEKLLALDEAKDEFVSMASHQLRTPLTSIKGYLSMVLEGDAGNITDTQKKMLGQAFYSSQRMVYLIADLLNVSRLKTGKFIIESSEVDLAKLVEEEMSQLQKGAKSKNITLQYKTPKNIPILMLDDMKTRQVVMNFTDNAIYYTPEGGKIKVELHNRGKSVEFTVTDTGMGVPKDQQHKLFTKFFRADNAQKARPDGTGLGLFMAKKIIVSQGGSIIFKSKEGKGSTFGFSFPKENLLAEDKKK